MRRTIHASELMKSMNEHLYRRVNENLNSYQIKYLDKIINEIREKVIKDKPEFDRHPKKILYEGKEYDPYQELMKKSIALENIPESNVFPGDVCLAINGLCCPRMRRLIAEKKCTLPQLPI